MNLYLIDSEMESLFNALGEPDLPDDERAILQEHFDHLVETRATALEELAKSVMNDRSTVDAIDKEIKRLQDNKKELEAREERKLKTLCTACGEGTTQLGAFTLKSRAGREKLVCDDEKELVGYLLGLFEFDCITSTCDQHLNKEEIKQRIKKGAQFPGARIVCEPTWTLR